MPPHEKLFPIGTMVTGPDKWYRDWMNRQAENIAHGRASIIEAYAMALLPFGVEVKEAVVHQRPGCSSPTIVRLSNGREYSGDDLMMALHAAWVDLIEEGGIWKR